MKISIIVPYYKAEKWIRRCCESLHLNKGEFEFIFVNDLSSDKSEDIVNTDTNDNTFTFGNVGRYIRDLFKEPSRFEV